MPGYVAMLIRDLAVDNCCATSLSHLKPPPPGEWTMPEHVACHPLGGMASLWQQCPGLASGEDPWE